MRSLISFVSIGLALVSGPTACADVGDGKCALLKSEWFDERTCISSVDPEVRMHVNVPLTSRTAERTRVLVYALPNGNTIEQTLGCRMTPDRNWRFDIQHVAAQVRLIRSLNSDERIVLVCAEAGGLSWPSWRRRQTDPNRKIVQFVDNWRQRFGGENALVTLCGHSGGGSFLWGLIEGSAQIPSWVDRIAFLDANYSFDAPSHAEKIYDWLFGHEARRLNVVAYDDREITLNGKQVVGPAGGTFRATNRMLSALRPRIPIAEHVQSVFTEYIGLDGRIRFDVHRNPENKILHTALVGEMNGLVHVQTLGTPLDSTWGSFGGPRAYDEWIQPVPADATLRHPRNRSDSPATSGAVFPARPNAAMGGLEFMRQVEDLSLKERESRAFREITSGNFPEFLRRLQRIPLNESGGDRNDQSGVMEVMCDYLAVGSDNDFVRIPLTPQTAQKIADQFGCVLPTRKLVDIIDRHADIQVAPHPLIKDREAVATFVQHHAIIESQRGQHALGALITGIKKDVVLSPRIFERPQRLAIYGWRKLDGRPIQNLTIAHWNGYVDYSHGIRLIASTIEIDGERVEIPDLMRDEQRCEIVSDEGPMDPPRYPIE